MTNTNNITRTKAIQRTILISVAAFLVYLIPLMLSNKGVAMETNNCKRELKKYKNIEAFVTDKFHNEINSLIELITAYNKEEKANTNLETDITNKISDLKRLLAENKDLPEKQRTFLSDIVSGFALVNDAYKSMYILKDKFSKEEAITQVGNQTLHQCQQKNKELQMQLLKCQADLQNLGSGGDLAACRQKVIALNNEMNRIINLAKEKGIRIIKRQ